MSDILIKNVPKKVHQKLKEMAQYHHRSMTKEALLLLEEAAAHYEAAPKDEKERSESQKAAEERRRRMKAWIKRYTGILKGKTTTDEVMKSTRGE